MKRLSSLFIVFHLVAVTCAAQSLGDVARKEEARREHVKKSTKVYTNKDLKGGDVLDVAGPSTSDTSSEGDAQATPSEEPGAPSVESAEPDTEHAAPSTEAAPASSAPSTRDEWHKKMADAQAQLDRTKMFAEALQSRANALWADFTARDDPAQRSAIEVERRKTLAELDRTKADIQAQTKAIADLEEQARRAGVPPGWLR